MGTVLFRVATFLSSALPPWSSVVESLAHRSHQLPRFSSQLEPFRHGLNYIPLSFLILQDIDGRYWNGFSSVTPGANNSNLLLIFFLWNTLKPWQIQSSLKILKLLEETKTAISPDLCSAFHAEALSPRKSCSVRKYVFPRPCTCHEGGAHMVSRKENLNMYLITKYYNCWTCITETS